MAILFVFTHHCAKLFDYHNVALYNADRSLALSMFREFNLLWMMPLFFIISGAAVNYSLKSRATGAFIRERIVRILIPLLIVGTFVINPIQVYAERLFQGKTTATIIQWYPHFFEGMYLAGGNFIPLGMGTHLWYLQYLFCFSLVLLPFFMPYGRIGKSVIARMSRWFEKPWALFLLFAPLSAASAAMERTGLGFTRIAGGWDPLTFFIFFIYGYLIFSNARIQETVRKYGLVSLGAAVVLTIGYLDSHFGVTLVIPGVTRHALHDVGSGLLAHPLVLIFTQAFRGLLAWLWLIAILGVGQRFLNSANRFLAYANEAVLPFYILHFPIIWIVGYYVIQWNSAVSTKFVVITGLSFLTILAVYEFLVRRLNVVRFLFGMKPYKREEASRRIVPASVGRRQ